MRWIRLAVPTLIVASAVVAAACSSDNGTGPNQPVPGSGTYAIISLTQSGTSVDTPFVSGDFTLSNPNKYKVRILLTVPTPDSIVDSGTYAFATPNKVTLNSATAGVALAGTYTYNSTSGALSVVIPAENLTLNAQKQ
ncbi:MAG TPA: hypothetical protein VMH88_07530 [Gemmatimonadales bacterium]|nr:hypothetical protein [Gemmatimonadales bacterium]